MSTQQGNTTKRDPLALGLLILVGISLLAAAYFLALGYPTDGPEESVSIPIVPPPGQEGSQGNGGDEEWVITLPASVTADDLRELATALAAVITALTGLFGIVFTQVWRRREEDRADKTHALELERERLELEKGRMQLERDRLALEEERQALAGGPQP